MACPGDTRETHLVMGPVSQLSGSIITITCFYWIMNLKKKGGRRGDSGGGWVMGGIVILVLVLVLCGW